MAQSLQDHDALDRMNSAYNANSENKMKNSLETSTRRVSFNLENSPLRKNSGAEVYQGAVVSPNRRGVHNTHYQPTGGVGALPGQGDPRQANASANRREAHNNAIVHLESQFQNEYNGKVRAPLQQNSGVYTNDEVRHRGKHLQYDAAVNAYNAEVTRQQNGGVLPGEQDDAHILGSSLGHHKYNTSYNQELQRAGGGANPQFRTTNQITNDTMQRYSSAVSGSGLSTTGTGAPGSAGFGHGGNRLKNHYGNSIIGSPRKFNSSEVSNMPRGMIGTGVIGSGVAAANSGASSGREVLTSSGAIGYHGTTRGSGHGGNSGGGGVGDLMGGGGGESAAANSNTKSHYQNSRMNANTRHQRANNSDSVAGILGGGGGGYSDQSNRNSANNSRSCID